MKKTVLIGVVCLLGSFASASVLGLEQKQAAHSNVVYQYTFEGSTATERLDQKISPNTPDLTAFKTSGFATDVDFVEAYAGSGSAALVKAGTLSGGKRNTGAALKTASAITFPTSGTIEYMVKATAINDTGFAVAGAATNTNSRWYFFQNGTNATDKAVMMLGAVTGYDLIGGTTAVAYKTNAWYYVAQTWSISGGTITMNAWVADLSLETPVLTQTVSNRTASHGGGTSTLLRLGSLADASNFFAGELDTVAVYNTILSSSTIESNMQTAALGSIQKEFWVSPSGSDSNAGTLAAPFLTITKARDTVRSFLTNMTGDVVVYLRSGDYFLSSTVTFGNSDSGTGTFRVVYKNWDAVGSPRIILGTKITSAWNADPAMTGVWTNTVSTNLALDSLYYGERRGHVARYPNKKTTTACPSAMGEYLIAKSGSSTNLQYFPGDVNPGTWTLMSNPKMYVWTGTGYPDWGLLGYAISSVDVTNQKISSSSSFSYPVDARDRYYLEGVLEFLDAEGEFYYDKSTGLLRYISVGGANPGQNVIIPNSAGTTFVVQGSAIGNHVRNISFEGLYFWCSRVYGIYLNRTENIDVINCHFKFMGREAVYMKDDNENNLVSGCWIENCGYGGIFIYNSLDRTAYPSNKSRGHIVENCKIQDVTEVTCHATENGGVIIWNASDCLVSQCEIFNATRYATTLRGHYSTESVTNDNGRHFAVSNVFENIKVSCVGSDSGDMGAVHAAAVNPTGGSCINYWRDIIIDHITAHPSVQDIKPNGVFLDHAHSTENQNFKNIKILRTQGIPYRTNNNPDQTLSNCSWVAGFNESLLSTSIGLESNFPSAYSGASTTPLPPCDTASMRGQIVVDDGDAGYSESGNWVQSTIGDSYSGDARYNNNSVPGEYAQSTPSIPVAGRYGVYVWKCGISTSALSAVNYQIQFSGGTLSNWVDQANQVNYAYWEKLGTYYFPAGGSGYVKEIAGTPVYVDSRGFRADAVRFVGEHAVVPEAYFALDETSGTAANDLTLNNHSGMLLGSPLPVRKAGRIGNCLEVNGSTSYVSVPDHSNLDVGTNDWAISIWFLRHANATTNLRLLSKGAQSSADSGYAIYGSDTSIAATVGDGSTRIIASANHGGVGTWNHLVVNIFRNGSMDIYLNGVLATSADVSAMQGSNIQNSWPLEIGRNVGANCYWDGEIDEVRIFRRILLAEDIEALYRVQ